MFLVALALLYLAVGLVVSVTTYWLAVRREYSVRPTRYGTTQRVRTEVDARYERIGLIAVLALWPAVLFGAALFVLGCALFVAADLVVKALRFDG